MKNFLMLFMMIFLFNCTEPLKKEKSTTQFYVGTYTNGDSEGIYTYRIDSTGKLSKIGLVAKTENPSFLTKTKDNETLIAVNETDKEGTGFVTSFQIKNDSLVVKNTSKSGGAHPCFINVNDKNQVLVANYTGGNVGYLKIDGQNELTNLLDIQQHSGSGTTPRQQSPHAHSTWFHPKKEEIISVDLGTNELWFSSLTKEDKFIASKQQKLKMMEGAGPRHLTFHPSHQWIYVLNELNNTISLVKEKDSTYYVDTSITMLPEDFNEYSKGADIHISDDGKFLYASNRGHNSIVIYSVDSQNGTLSLVGFESVKGQNPRNFSLTPDNQFLLVANQDSNTIISFKRDINSGELTFVDEIEAPTPVCILF